MPRFGLLVALSAIVVGIDELGRAGCEADRARTRPHRVRARSGTRAERDLHDESGWKRQAIPGGGILGSMVSRREPVGFRPADAPVGLYVIKRDGTGLRRLVARFVTSPTWSPDGRQIAFWTSSGLAVISTAAGRVRRLTRGEDENPVWSPTENRIAFMRWQGDRFAIATVNADGTQVGVLTPASYNAHNPTWSPDGRRLAFNGNSAISATGTSTP